MDALGYIIVGPPTVTYIVSTILIVKDFVEHKGIHYKSNKLLLWSYVIPLVPGIFFLSIMPSGPGSGAGSVLVFSTFFVGIPVGAAFQVIIFLYKFFFEKVKNKN